jgi:hypothetical protein
MEVIENKIILITYKDSQNKKPAEETFATFCLNSFGFAYKLIKYSDTDNTNFFGRLPVLYFNGNIIPHRNVIGFLFALIDIDVDRDLQMYFDNVLYLLRDELRFNSEYYVVKRKQKAEKSFFEAIKSLFYRNSNIDEVSEQAVCLKEKVASSYPNNGSFNVSKLNTINKIRLLGEYRSSSEYFNKVRDLLIYTYLEEDKSLEDVFENYRDKIAAFPQLPVKTELNIILAKYRMKFSTKHKEKKILLQEQQITNNFYQQVITFGVFITFTGVMYLLSKWK